MGVSEQSLEKKPVPGFRVPGRGRNGPILGPPESRAAVNDKIRSQDGLFGGTIDVCQEAKAEILAKTRRQPGGRYGTICSSDEHALNSH